MTDDAATNPPEALFPLNLSAWSSRAAQTAPAMTAAPTQLIAVPGYEILRELGRGGMGVVYLARQTTLNRQVALKMLLHGPHATPDLLTRFHAECQIVARLRDPGIVQVFDSGHHDGLPYCALEYLPGGSLADKLPSGLPAPKAAAQLIQRLAQALGAAHLAGVVHRDLKPANVLFTADGQPKITDFGLALDAAFDTRVTGTGVAVGTPNYMAPEQARADKAAIGPAADVYALGAILYECLTGRPPFAGTNLLEVLGQVVSAEPVSPARLGRAVPRDLEVICLKCLAKEPGHRYPSALALADDLGRFLEDRPIAARPAGEFEKLARWARRNPGVTGMAAAVAVIFLAAFALVTRSFFQAEAALEAKGQALQKAEQREREERWERYRANLFAGAGALELDQFVNARQYLEAAPPEHRNWEWRHFTRQVHTPHQVLATVPAPVQAVGLVSNGNRGWVLRPGPALQFWDARERRALAAIPWGAGWGAPLVSPDGDRIALAEPDHTIRILEAATGRTLAVLRGHTQPVGWMRFLDASPRLLSFSPGERALRLWDLPTGQELRVWRDVAGPIKEASPDGRRLVGWSAAEQALRLRDLATEAETAFGQGLGDPISVAFNAQGDRLVSAGRYPHTSLWLWEVPTGRRLAELPGHTSDILRTRFSPDGSRLATCGLDATVRLWDGRTGAPVAALAEHHGRVYSADFSPDGARLVTASQDQTVRLWDAATGAPRAVLLGHTEEVFGAKHTPDGAAIVSVSRLGTLLLWDAALAERTGVLRGHTNFVYGVAWRPDGAQVASCGWDGTVRLWDATTGRQTGQLAYDAGAIVTAVAYHPGGQLLASVGRENAVRLWDLATGQVARRWALPTHEYLDCRLAFSPGGDLLAAGDAKGTVHLWDVATGTAVAALAGPAAVPRAVAFSPDGRRLAVCAGGTVRVWDLATRQLVADLASPEVMALAFDRAGRRLVAGGTAETAQVWDTATWQVERALPHGAKVYGAAFTADGTRLLTACSDNTVRVWDLATYQEVAQLRGHGAYVYQLAFSPDGTRLATASGDFTVRVWDTLSAQERVAPVP